MQTSPGVVKDWRAPGIAICSPGVLDKWPAWLNPLCCLSTVTNVPVWDLGSQAGGSWQLPAPQFFILKRGSEYFFLHVWLDFSVLLILKKLN